MVAHGFLHQTSLIWDEPCRIGWNPSAVLQLTPASPSPLPHPQLLELGQTTGWVRAATVPQAHSDGSPWGQDRVLFSGEDKPSEVPRWFSHSSANRILWIDLNSPLQNLGNYEVTATMTFDFWSLTSDQYILESRWMSWLVLCQDPSPNIGEHKSIAWFAVESRISSISQNSCCQNL